MSKTVDVLLMPGTTIEALIRHHNNYSVDKAGLKALMEQFNALNPNALPPRAGMRVLIPVITDETNKNTQS